jgi:ribonuclease E
MKKEMLINVLQPEEIRIAIVEDNVLEELYVERTSHESYVGNIYKGRIVNIEPSIQAAFVDFGVGRNGFLHVSDVEPAYYQHLEQGRDGNRRGRDRGRGPRDDRGGPRRQRREPPPDFADVREEVEQEIQESPIETIEINEPIWEEEIVEESLEQVTFEEPETIDDFGKSAPVADAAWEDDKTSPDASVESETAETPHSEAPHSEAPDAETDKNAPRGRGRRRGRGRSRGRRGREEQNQAEKPGTAPSPEADANAPSGPNHGEQPQAEQAPREGSEDGAPPRDWPRLMESAEHRTSEGGDISDEELSFSMRPPKEGAAEKRPERHERERHFAPEVHGEEALETYVPPEAGFEEPETTPTFVDEPLEEFIPDEAPMPSLEETQGEALERAFDRPEELNPQFSEEEEYAPRRRGRGPRDDRHGDRRNDRRGGRRDDHGDSRRGGGGRGRGGPMSRQGSGRPGMGRPKPLIQDIFKRGQEVLVQVIKEGIGTKGPTLSTYISIAGRYLVLMPGLNRIGVSRKIIDEEARRRLREILHDLQPPKGLGFIIRTAGIDRNKKELQRDLAYLSRLWQVVVRRIKKTKSPCEIYQESDMITRTIRDIFTSEIDSITVDEKTAFEHAKEFLQIVMPRYANRINYYDSTEPMFHRYGIETEIARIQQRHVPLAAGGSIVIDQTEALVAIDVNSGNFRADGNAEETAYQMNLQAAKEIARQLRLRDLGGVIVNDFIDMREERHRRGVEKALRDAIKRDRARTKILRISQFGIIEMTRQRIRPSLKRSVYQDCPHCQGTGQVKTCESMSIDVMRFLQLATHNEHIRRIEIRVHEDVAHYLLNRKRKEVAQLESAGEKQVNIRHQSAVSPEFLQFSCYDAIDNEVKFMPYDEPPPRRHRSRR